MEPAARGHVIDVLPPEAFLPNAPAADGTAFLVPRVLDGEDEG